MNSYSSLSLSAARSTYRDRTALVFNFLFPLVFLVGFGLVFSTAGAGGYMNSLAPGVIAYGVGYSASFAGANFLIVWRNNGMLKMLQLAPIGKLQILSSRLGVAIVVGLGQTVLFVFVALLPPFNLALGATAPFVAISSIIGVCAFFAFGVFLSNRLKTTEALAAVLNVIFLPMALVSGVFFPLSFAPDWFTTVSYFLPLHDLAYLTAYILVDTGDGSVALLCLGILALCSVGLFAASARTLRWDQEG